MIRERLTSLLREAVAELTTNGGLPSSLPPPEIELERPPRPEHGDFSTNLAMKLAQSAGKSPREIAEGLVKSLPSVPEVSEVKIAGAGFINFYLSHNWLFETIREIGRDGESYGRSSMGEGTRIQVEYGSPNPTGPIHVGNARNIVYGDALASLLSHAGFEVERENYVNDSGRQTQQFAISLEARYRQALGQDVAIPEDGYQGEYLIELGRILAEKEGMGLIGKLDEIASWGIEQMIEQQRQTLTRLGVSYHTWMTQDSLEQSGQVELALGKLRQKEALYDHEGATWFRATDYGHSQDQVLVRSAERGGLPTYLAADAAYLLHKIERGFDRVIYFWGADHHNTAGALMALARAFEVEDRVEVIIYQFVTFRGGRLSKRSGEFITLDEMLDEVGADGTRFTFLTRNPDSSMVFDFDLVKSESQENPVYYVQYAHARIASLLRHASSKGISLGPIETAPLIELTHDSEHSLIRKLAEFPETIETSAKLRAPYRLTTYAREVAELFHAFYRDCQVIGDEAELTQARMWLSSATRKVLANTLAILGVSAPERM